MPIAFKNFVMGRQTFAASLCAFLVIHSLRIAEHDDTLGETDGLSDSSNPEMEALAAVLEEEKQRTVSEEKDSSEIAQYPSDCDTTKYFMSTPYTQINIQSSTDFADMVQKCKTQYMDAGGFGGWSQRYSNGGGWCARFTRAPTQAEWNAAGRSNCAAYPGASGHCGAVCGTTFNQLTPAPTPPTPAPTPPEAWGRWCDGSVCTVITRSGNTLVGTANQPVTAGSGSVSASTSTVAWSWPAGSAWAGNYNGTFSRDRITWPNGHSWVLQAAPAPAAAASPAPTCSRYNAFDGHTTWKGRCCTLDKCRNACHNDSSCAGFNWWARRGGCRHNRGTYTLRPTLVTTFGGPGTCTTPPEIGSPEGDCDPSLCQA